MTGTETHRMLSLTLALGVLSGAALVLAYAFFVNGKELLVPYAVVALLCGVVTRGERIEAFRSRFLVLLGAFMLSSIALYFAMRLDPGVSDLSVLGHAWRVGVMLAIGAAISLPIARVTKPPSRSVAA